MPITVTDEVFDESGQLVASRLRDITEPAFTLSDYLQARRQVRALLASDTVPVWGKILARYLLMQDYLEVESEPIVT